MNIRTFWNTLFALTFLFAAHLLVGQDHKKKYTRKDIEPYILSSMEAGDIPGLSFVIIEGDKHTIKTYGFADEEDQTPVSAKTLFELASCSKAFTGLAITTLEQQDLISLEDPVSDYLPWLNVMYEEQPVELKIRDLLYHTSGIPWTTISNIPASTEANALEKTVKALVGQELRHLPGKEFEYATINYDVLALILEKVTDQPFETYLQREIIDGLGLSSTSVGEPSEPALMAQGHKIGFFEARAFDAPRFKGNNAAGYVMSNATDMAKWLKFQLGQQDSPLYSAAQLTHERDETVAIHGYQLYARGWQVSLDGTGLIFHGGLNPNFSSFVGFQKEKQLGVVILANSNSRHTAAIGRRVMKILGEEEIEAGVDPGDMGDQKFAFGTFALALYCFVVLGFVGWIFVDVAQGKRKYEGFGVEVSTKLIRTLVFLAPIVFAIYLLPKAMVGFEWESMLLWTPSSFEWLIKMMLVSITVSYVAYFFSLLYPEPNAYKRSIPQILLLSIISGLANVVIIIMVTSALDVEDGLGYLLFYYAITLCLYLLGSRFVQINLVKFTRGIIYDLRIKLIQKVFSTSYQNFEKIERGRVYTSINEDVNTIGQSTNTIVTLITNVITTIGAFIFLTAIASWATLVTVFLILAIATLYYFVSQRANQYYNEARDSRDVFMTLVNGMIDGFKEISLRRNKKLAYKEDISNSAMKFKEKTSIADIKFVDAFLVGESLLVVLLGGVGFGMSRLFPDIEFHIVMSFVIILLYLIGPINVILSSVPALVQLKIAWQRVNGFIQEIPATLDLDQLPEAAHVEVECFAVKNVEFQYGKRSGSRTFGIGPINLELYKGEILFIIGGNGSGKTTLAKLLVGLYEPEGGQILINGRPTSAAEVGEYYSTVFSHSNLFKKLYDLDLEHKEDEISKYLEMLDLQDKVSIENNEFSTIDLSSGQRKRLALLQCFLEDSPIYLFDEWAADQDPSYRKFFYRTLLPEMRRAGKIVIAITHDDHYFDVADRVIKMSNGVMEEYVDVMSEVF